MTIIQFPIGGKDFKYEELTRRPVSNVEAYRRLAFEHPDILANLDRALRIQHDVQCYLPDELEMSVFRLVGSS